MFISQKSHDEIVSDIRKKYDTQIDDMILSHRRDIKDLEFQYNSEVTRLESEKSNTIADLTSKHEIALDRAKAKLDAREIELMAEIRIANNNAELTKANAALTIERIEKDAESRIKTAQDAANVVLSNAQLEAAQLIAAGKARGEELSYQISKKAVEDTIDLYDDIIDTLTTKIPLEQIDLSKVRDLITASTSNFPSVVGDVNVSNRTK